MNQRCRNEPNSGARSKVDREVFPKLSIKKTNTKNKTNKKFGNFDYKANPYTIRLFSFLPSMHDHQAYIFFYTYVFIILLYLN